MGGGGGGKKRGVKKKRIKRIGNKTKLRTVKHPQFMAPKFKIPKEGWGGGAMTTEFKSYIELRKMGSV